MTYRERMEAAGYMERRPIDGVFMEYGSDDAMHEKLEVHVINDDAFESYKRAIDYFNDTCRPHETPRLAVSAEWHVVSAEAEHIKNCRVCADRVPFNEEDGEEPR